MKQTSSEVALACPTRSPNPAPTHLRSYSYVKSPPVGPFSLNLIRARARSHSLTEDPVSPAPERGIITSDKHAHTDRLNPDRTRNKSSSTAALQHCRRGSNTYSLPNVGSPIRKSRESIRSFTPEEPTRLIRKALYRIVEY